MKPQLKCNGSVHAFWGPFRECQDVSGCLPWYRLLYTMRKDPKYCGPDKMVRVLVLPDIPWYVMHRQKRCIQPALLLICWLIPLFRRACSVVFHWHPTSAAGKG
eukprot:1029420-Pyramimonas_sp.AAC.2